MNEYIFLATAIIGGFFSLAAIQLMNSNWFKREKAKYNYQVRRAKMKQKGIPVNKPAPTGAMDWISTLKNVDPDLLHNLIDQFGGGPDEEETGDLGNIVGDLVKNNPEIVKGFLEGVNKKTKGEEQGNDNLLYTP